ncbi:MAG: putative bifunctional diguanylate cyclase/phosphodiesterase [Alphaproteobacteria bacterium]|jgi:predicted signal transduction protein with EAL and GGDEF domain|nr:bifunctional diguanylate cyclase/phosphodiesterase [Alphaproteobacteria bacterium]
MVVRPHDTVVRLGGDEFTVLLEPVEALEEAKIISQRILDHLNQPYMVLGKEVHISSSIGLTLIDETVTEPQSVLQNADLAMYHAKTTGKARLEIFDQYQHEKLIQNMQMESDLRQALAKNEFCIYYQPVVDVETQHLFGFEALMRWEHGGLGFVSPAEFIPLAEEIGLIGRMGEFVLRKAAQQVGSWIDLVGFDRCPHVSVNISVRQLLDFYCFEGIMKLLNDIGEKRRYLILEVTESVIIRDPTLIIQRLERIKSLGSRISIDDFGTGYSSLSYLHSFPFDFLKIDRAFIEGMIKDPKAERLVSTIIGMAKDLGLKTVAEGVENKAQLSRLKELSCPYAQGYLFSPALDVAHATNYLVKYLSPQDENLLLSHIKG